MRVIPHPEAEQLRLTGVLHALSDSVRLRIVWALADGQELCTGGLCTDVSRSTLSHHLKVLRDAGLTRTRTVGVQRLVSLRHQDLAVRFPGLLELVLSNAPVSDLVDSVPNGISPVPVAIALDRSTQVFARL
ncbi:MAG: ArsR/SmtB family transcription factor [Solirubrobacteraceae bacterium]